MALSVSLPSILDVRTPSAPEVLVPLKFLSGFVKVQWSVIPCQVCGSNAAPLGHYVGSLERTPL